LIELLTAIVIIGILAGLLTTALAKAKGKAGGIGCLNNTRQLSLAWLLYAGDNNELLPYNLGGPVSRGIAPKRDYNWVNNLLDWEVLNTDNTNTDFVAKGSFAAFANRAARIYRCPSDHVLSQIQKQAGWVARVRSYSMNAMVGDAGNNSRYGTNIFNPQYRQFKRSTDFERPTEIFVFLDEHPDSLNDGYFLNRLEDLEWTDLPASYHNGAASFTFADGHAEMHRWVSPATKPPARPDAARLPRPVAVGDSADFDWVRDRTSLEVSSALSKTSL
jgi:prepilin-type processing-associated H-X9-DG protein